MTGLIGWWPLHETSGDTAHDISGNQNHGELQNTEFIARNVVGVSGLSSTFFDADYEDDEGGFVNIGDDDILNPGFSNFSFGFWFNLDESPADFRRVFEKGDWSDQSYYVWAYENDEIRVRVTGTDGSGERPRIFGLIGEDEGWHHIFVNVNRQFDIMEVYIDGSLEETGDVSGIGEISPSQPLMLMRDPREDRYHIKGSLNDVRIYNRVLSPSEVRELYRQGSQDLHKKSLSDGSDIGVVSRWKLNDGGADGSTAVDSWGSNDGTINGASFTDNSVRNEGRALQFDGNDDHVDTGFEFPTEDSPLTVSAWAKFDDLTDHRSVVSSHDNDPERGFQIRYDESMDQIIFATYNDEGSWTVTESGVKKENVWLHITGVYTGEEHRIYINGVLKGRASLDSVATTDLNLVIGSAPERDEDMNGIIDDVRVYNRALKPWEVFELYRWGSLGKDMRKELVNAKGGGQ